MTSDYLSQRSMLVVHSGCERRQRTHLWHHRHTVSRRLRHSFLEEQSPFLSCVLWPNLIRIKAFERRLQDFQQARCCRDRSYPPEDVSNHNLAINPEHSDSREASLVAPETCFFNCSCNDVLHESPSINLSASKLIQKQCRYRVRLHIPSSDSQLEIHTKMVFAGLRYSLEKFLHRGESTPSDGESKNRSAEA